MRATARSPRVAAGGNRRTGWHTVSAMLVLVGIIMAACVAFSVAATASLATNARSPRAVREAPARHHRDHPSLVQSCRHQAARSEPSAASPPRSSRLAGFTLSYCTDFPGHTIPAGWFKFSGVPSGDPSGLFVRSHVLVAHGRLSLRVSRVPQHRHGWGTAGVCHCGLPRLYGAFFVRSRVTGPGPDEIDLLWPVAHVWPPEIDFNESIAHSGSTTWSVHFGHANTLVQGGKQVDLTRWHTWGVVWAPGYIRFLVDGHAWGSVTNRAAVPHQPMTLDIQNQTFCGRGTECPRRPVTMQVDWVAEYAYTRPCR